tara:strand:- start:143 stop:1162 length:1020 start_codon:yes stop_codon:yes gene_type:complete
MRILVTGGSGFIGSTLIKFLLQDKKNIILNVDKLSKFSIPESLNFTKKIKNYNFIKLDICNLSKLQKIIFKFKPTIIVHLAAESHVDRSIKEPSDFINSNIIGTYNLLTCFKYYLDKNKSKNTKNLFLHVSTDEVYGSLNKRSKPFNEKSNYLPNSPYSASKASSDFLARAWHKTFNLPVIITHCSNNYGPWQFPEKLIPLMIYRGYKKMSMPVYGDGKNIRDWIFVEDHVRVLLSIIKKGKIGQVYNIGSGQEISNIRLVKEICKILDNKFPSTTKHLNLIHFVKDRKGHDFRYAILNNKVKKTFNFKKQYNFKDGLKLTVDWYLKNIDWLISKSKNL